MAEITLTKENFETEVKASAIPVLIDFWATWCGPCRMLSPVIEAIANEYDGKIKVGKVNVDEQPELASVFGITSIPTVVLMNNGNVVSTSVGYKPKEQLVKLFSELL